MRKYKHRGQYLEGGNFWYQNQDSNAWLGPAEVVNPSENKVWLYMNGNMLKVTACRVKPYELIPREENKIDADDKNCENVEKDIDKQDLIENKEEIEENSEAVQNWF